MLTILIPLLLQLGLLSSEATWHCLTLQEQQELTESIIVDDVNL